jgi:hypothetical protein
VSRNVLVTGTVRNAQGTPGGGAKVQFLSTERTLRGPILLASATTSAGPTGSYQLQLAPGAYRATVDAVAQGYACCASEPVNISDPSSVRDFTVSPGVTFTGQVQLPQSSGSAPPTRVVFVQTDTQEVIRIATPEWSGGGMVTVPQVPPGTYDVSLKVHQHVSVVARQVPFGSSSPVSRAFGTLAAGDADHNDQVTAADFSVLKRKFGQSAPCTAWWLVRCADFDLNGQIGPNDFTLLKQSFGVVGPPLRP